MDNAPHDEPPDRSARELPPTGPPPMPDPAARSVAWGPPSSELDPPQTRRAADRGGADDLGIPPAQGPHRGRRARRGRAVAGRRRARRHPRGDGGGADEASDAVAIDNVGVDSASSALSVAEIVDGLADSVVSIETTVRYRRGPFDAEGTGAGTGVVLDDGYIVTNAHVVEGATEVEVTVPGSGATLVATIVGSDPANDIAVLHVDDTSGLVPASLGSSDLAAVGDSVVAIGNALALEGGLTVTQGIVSALDRSVETVRGHARRPDPDRCRDQLRQLGRATGQRPRRGDRHQLGGRDQRGWGERF